MTEHFVFVIPECTEKLPHEVKGLSEALMHCEMDLQKDSKHLQVGDY